LTNFYFLFRGLELPINTQDCIEVKVEFQVPVQGAFFFFNFPRIYFRLGSVNGKIGLLNEQKEMSQELFKPNCKDLVRISLKIKLRGFANISKSKKRNQKLISREIGLFNSDADSAKQSKATF
jgi:hypothetical protein